MTRKNRAPSFSFASHLFARFLVFHCMIDIVSALPFRTLCPLLRRAVHVQEQAASALGVVDLASKAAQETPIRNHAQRASCMLSSCGGWMKAKAKAMGGKKAKKLRATN
jgi:hypothetical protein